MRLLTHLPAAVHAELAARLLDDELVEVPSDGTLDASLRGEALITLRFPWPNLARSLERGVTWIQIFGTGIDGFPLEVVGERTVTCCRGATARPIAEWIMAMILAHAKNLPDVWMGAPRERRTLVPIVDGLHERTVALLGFGSIGSALASLLLPFGARVVAVRRTELPADVDGVEVMPFREAIRSADHVVLCLPSTAETERIIDRSALAQMKRGVHVVNVSRGCLIDDDALRAALEDGTVARASLDTTSPEPLPAGHWMYEDPRVRLSPHCSWGSDRGITDLIDYVAVNVNRWRSGEPLAGVVDLASGY